MMKNLNCIVLAAILALGLCTPTVDKDYSLSIEPSGDENPYIMRVDEVQIYNAKLCAVSEEGAVVPHQALDYFVWDFDKRYLQKAGASAASITFQAVEQGTTQLKAQALFNGKFYNAEIRVIIE